MAVAIQLRTPLSRGRGRDGDGGASKAGRSHKSARVVTRQDPWGSTRSRGPGNVATSRPFRPLPLITGVRS